MGIHYSAALGVNIITAAAITRGNISLVGKSFTMKLHLLFVMAMMMGLAYSQESCCRHAAGVRCAGDKCDLASQEELDDCPEDCPLRGCDLMTLIQCGGKLLQCGGICIKHIFPPTQDVSGASEICFKSASPV